MIPGRSSFAHAIGHDADAGADFSFALGLLPQGHGPFCSGFGITAYRCGVHAYSMALFPNGNGIGAIGFSLGPGADGNGIQPCGPGSVPYGQSPFPFCMGIIAQGGCPHGPIGISPGPYCQGIGSLGSIIEIIPVPVTVFRVHLEFSVFYFSSSCHTSSRTYSCPPFL